MKNAAEIESGLAQFYGTESYTRSTFGSLLWTDGVMWLAQNAECFWLLDIIESYQPKARRHPMLKEMQFWTLKVKDGAGVVTCDDGNGNIEIKQEIPFTDFPMGEVKVWVELGSVDGVTPSYIGMLPSER